MHTSKSIKVSSKLGQHVMAGCGLTHEHVSSEDGKVVLGGEGFVNKAYSAFTTVAEEIGAGCYLANYFALRRAKAQITLNFLNCLVGLSLAPFGFRLACNDSYFAIVKSFVDFSHVFLHKFANVAHFEASSSSHHFQRYNHWLLGSKSERVGRVQREVMWLFVQRYP